MTEGEWISIDDRLPDTGELVAVIYGDSRVTLARHIKTTTNRASSPWGFQYGWKSPDESCKLHDVTHWQPLPKPPEREPEKEPEAESEAESELPVADPLDDFLGAMGKASAAFWRIAKENREDD